MTQFHIREKTQKEIIYFLLQNKNLQQQKKTEKL